MAWLAGFRWQLLVLAVVVVVVAAVLIVPGGPSCPDAEPTLAESRFDTGDEGWRLSVDTELEDETGLQYETTEGAHGGYVHAADPKANDTWYFVAPEAFRGDLSCAYGGTLVYDIRQSRTDNQFSNHDVRIAGADQLIALDLDRRPGTEWTTMSARIEAEAGWVVVRDDGTEPATEEVMRDVLSHVSSLSIRGEYRTGPDIGDLDNVALRSGPAAR